MNTTVARGAARQHDELDHRFVDELRGHINSSLANMGIVAAFMCALAANVYVNPCTDGDLAPCTACCV